MKKNLKTIIFFSLLFSAHLVMSQNVNSGELTILPNTQFVVNDNITNTGTIINDGTLTLFGNLTNNGILDFDLGGQTEFLGNIPQNITGNNTVYTYDILFNNVETNLGTDLSIAKTADLTAGIVNNLPNDINNINENNIIQFQTDSNVINASSSSHINADVIKGGSSSFAFPLGEEGVLREMMISAPESSSNFKARYRKQDSDGENGERPLNKKPGFIQTLSGAEYWTLERTAGNSNIVLTLTWNNETTPAAIINGDKQGLRILRWDSDKQFWVDQGGIIDEANQSVTTVTNVVGYGYFTLGRVLPSLLLPGGILAYNGISPNGDGMNDFLVFDGLEEYPDNTVSIFNRWGNKVYETKGYNNTDNVFTGFAEAGITIGKDNQLPTGTYYYVINYSIVVDSITEHVKKAGFIYLSGEGNSQ